MTLGQRVRNLLIAVDQLVYVMLTLGNGLPDETLSSAAFRSDVKGRIAGRIFRPSIDWLFRVFLGEEEHCFNAFLAERRRLQLPEEAR